MPEEERPRDQLVRPESETLLCRSWTLRSTNLQKSLGFRPWWNGIAFLSQAMNRNSCTRMSTKNESGRFMLPIVSRTKLNSTCAKREKKNAIPKKKYLSIHD